MTSNRTLLLAEPAEPPLSAPALEQHGSSTLILRWRPPNTYSSIEAEVRRAAWLFTAKWVTLALASDCVTADGEDVVVTLPDLDPQVTYDVRLVAVLGDGSRQQSPPAAFRTCDLAPPLTSPPELMCARHDRILLQWSGPAAQSDEVVAYRLRYFDCEPRWPVKVEVEAKLASRLLRPSEQTQQFLGGLVAMRIPAISTSGGSGDLVRQASDASVQSYHDEGAPVHFWLMSLAPCRMYYVQVAAVTAAGQGRWSPQSKELFTWRVAPALAVRVLLKTHRSLFLGLDVQQPHGESKHGQDEEIDKFEVQVAPAKRGGEEPEPVIATRDAAVELASRLRALLKEMQGNSCTAVQDASSIVSGTDDAVRLLAEGGFPEFVVVASGLCPDLKYSCIARAITWAGVGGASSACATETLPVAPDICDLRVDSVEHNTAAISWRVSEPSAPSPVMLGCMGDTAHEELEERKLRGFTVEVREDGKPWREEIGVRAKHGAQSISERTSVQLRLLLPNSRHYVRIAAVTRGSNPSPTRSPSTSSSTSNGSCSPGRRTSRSIPAGSYSKALQVDTEDVAPRISEVPSCRCTARTGFVVAWPTPPELDKAPVLGYAVYVFRERDKTRAQAVSPIEVSLGEVAPSETSARGTLPAQGDEPSQPDVEVKVWVEETQTCAKISGLEPSTAYMVQVAPRTNRGLGARSGISVLNTRRHGPEMGSGGPRLRESFYNQLVLECNGPVPDWSDAETSDVVGYRARYYEYARFGAQPWVQADVEYEDGEESTIRFSLRNLLPEKQYVVQVASVTAAGQGKWSASSDRVSTWRPAPSTTVPRLLFSTHTSMVLGWDVDPTAGNQPPGVLMRDESVTEFVLACMPLVGPCRETRTTRVTRSQAETLAARWRDAHAGRDHGLQDPRWVTVPSTQIASCDGQDSSDDGSEPPRFIAVVHGLTAGGSYMCTACALSDAGDGRKSPSTPELHLRPVAPRIQSIQVDEVGHDQILVSWEVPEGPPMLSLALCEDLGVGTSLEQLELRGFAVRYALWTSWTRLNWKGPNFQEVEALIVECAEDEPVSTAIVSTACRRAQFAIRDLEPEQLYVAEVRTHTASGPGEWRRISEQPICTAIVADAPPAPELVYSTSRALTFAFAAPQESKVVAYEVRYYEGRVGGWRPPSTPQRFDATSFSVRMANESEEADRKRWVVSLDQLRSQETYVLQLRGITRDGCVTKWSQRSEAMETQMPDGQADGDDEIGLSLERDQVKAERETSATETTIAADAADFSEDIFKKLEVIISYLMQVSTSGIKLPSMREPSVAERAEQLLLEFNGDRNAALRHITEGDDDVVPWRNKIADFLITQVPVVGCSSLLLRELWRNIRRCSLIAALYGHDTTSSETQALILVCLVPLAQGGGGAEGSGACPQGLAVDEVAGHGRRVAKIVSQALAKETLVRATGLRSAGKALSLLDDVGQMIRSYSSREANEGSAIASERPDGALASSSDPDAGVESRGASLSRRSMTNTRSETAHATPAEPGSSRTLHNGSAAAIEDNVQPSPQRTALTVFRPLEWQERPIFVMFLVALWFLPILGTVVRFVLAKLVPLLATRMETSVLALVALVVCLQAIGVLIFLLVHQHVVNMVRVPATLVFVVYTIMPGVSMCLATRGVIQGAKEAPFFALLGVYNMIGAFLRWAEDIGDDAAVEHRQDPLVTRHRQSIKMARQLLWSGLIADFCLEEFLGRQCGLHSFRLLGGTSVLAEYRTLTFAYGIIAAWSQGWVLALLQRRTVLLRLLGARKAVHSGLILMLMGAYAVVSRTQSLAFLRESSPTPRWCCVVLWIRSFGGGVGLLVPVLMHSLLHPSILGGLPLEALIPLSLAIGMCFGLFVCQTFNDLWLDKKEDLESDYRILSLFPHMSMQARSKARTAMRLAIRRGMMSTHDTAVSWATSRVARSAMNYFADWALVRNSG